MSAACAELHAEDPVGVLSAAAQAALSMRVRGRSAAEAYSGTG